MCYSVWSRNRKILDEFVQEARQHYIESPLPPRELISVPHDVSYEYMYFVPSSAHKLRSRALYLLLGSIKATLVMTG